MVYSSGEKYQGQWVNDRKEGTGTYTWRHGTYSGLWKGNQVSRSHYSLIAAGRSRLASFTNHHFELKTNNSGMVGRRTHSGMGIGTLKENGEMTCPDQRVSSADPI